MVEVMAQYTVKATRDGRFWFLHVIELDQYTQARSLSEIDEMARDLVHIVTDEAKNDITLVVTVELPVRELGSLLGVSYQRAQQLSKVE